MTREERQQNNKFQKVFQPQHTQQTEGTVSDQEVVVNEERGLQVQRVKQPKHEKKAERGKTLENTKWATHNISSRSKSSNTDTVSRR